MVPRGRILALILALLALAACDHEMPGAVRPPAELGPYAVALPRRLTFHTLNDRMPSVTGTELVYSRQGDAWANSGYTPYGREGCLAFMPVEGGTIQRLFCPSELLHSSDTLVHTWFEPSLSPDGARLAFTWQRAAPVGALGFLDADLLVTPADRPTDTTGVRVVVNYVEAGVIPRRASLATRITWLDEDRLRFLATYENVYKVKGGEGVHYGDTLFMPLALMELDLRTRALSAVPGGDSVVAYAAAPSGGVWVVREPHPDSLFLLDPATGARTVVGAFSSRVLDLIAVDGLPVAIVDPVVLTALVSGWETVHGGATIERLDPLSGTRSRLTAFAGPVRHLAAAGGKRFVAEIEQATLPFGAPSDLWLLEFP